ncbi:flavin reductase family protein [Nocardia sp. NPDC052566]|uniref:flavin reductase family protein n=1 Tax=Nocardia sp. NPDC052566 TaxID=3364330 RepID=UPI0037C815FA
MASAAATSSAASGPPVGARGQDPAARGVGADHFRALAGSLPTGVCVLTTLDAAGRPVGMTSGAVCGLSRVPPLLLACLDTTSRTLGALLQRATFGVNILAADAAWLSDRFAGDAPDRFAGVPWTPGPHGIPILTEGVVAHAICEVYRTVHAGDHLIVLGLITDGEHHPDADPLLYHRHHYSGFQPHSSAERSRTPRDTPHPATI